MPTRRRMPVSSQTRQARHLGLQEMLRAGQRDMKAVLQRRVQRVSHDRSEGGLDDSEHAEAHVQNDVDATVTQMKRRTLQGVQDALVRFDAGGDERCVACDGTIGEARLHVQPFAVRCITCQEAHEQRVAGERARSAPQAIDWR